MSRVYRCDGCGNDISDEDAEIAARVWTLQHGLAIRQLHFHKPYCILQWAQLQTVEGDQ